MDFESIKKIDKQNTEKLMDELRLKVIQLAKYSNDLKERDKIISAKSAILFKKEQELKIREIKLEERENVLKNMSL